MERRYFEGEIWKAAGELWKTCWSTTEFTQTNAGALRKTLVKVIIKIQFPMPVLDIP